MSASRLTLAAALTAIGVAQVFVGDPYTAGGMEALGATEGDITFRNGLTSNDLTAPEYTGDIPHQTTVVQGVVEITVPLINGQLDVYDKISAVGDGSGGGWDAPQDVVTTTVLLMPLREMAADGTFARTSAGVWTPATAGKHCLWIWRAYALTTEQTFGYDQGGKRINEVTFRGMYAGQNVNGHKVWTRGNPPAGVVSPPAADGTGGGDPVVI
jgi:hypothetical protein